MRVDVSGLPPICECVVSTPAKARWCCGLGCSRTARHVSLVLHGGNGARVGKGHYFLQLRCVLPLFFLCFVLTFVDAFAVANVSVYIFYHVTWARFSVDHEREKMNRLINCLLNNDVLDINGVLRPGFVGLRGQ